MKSAGYSKVQVPWNTYIRMAHMAIYPTPSSNTFTFDVFNGNLADVPCKVANGDQDLDQWARRFPGNRTLVLVPVVKEEFRFNSLGEL